MQKWFNKQKFSLQLNDIEINGMWNIQWKKNSSVHWHSSGKITRLFDIHKMDDNYGLGDD